MPSTEYYRKPLPSVQQLSSTLSGILTNGGREARLPHICGNGELSDNPGLRAFTNRHGNTSLTCYYGHEWPEPEEAVRQRLGPDYIETTKRDMRTAVLHGGAESIAGVLSGSKSGENGLWTADCPVASCLKQGALRIWNLADHEFSYLGLSCESCGSSYDTLHKQIVARCDSAGVRWRQQASYMLRDGEPRFHQRHDGAGSRASKNVWDVESKGRQVGGRAPCRWTDGSIALLVEGAKAAAALASSEIGSRYAIYSLGDTSGLRNGDVASIGTSEVVLWPDRDKEDQSRGNSRPGETAMWRAATRLISLRKRVRIVDVSNMPDGVDAADFVQEEASNLLGSAVGRQDTDRFKQDTAEVQGLIEAGMSNNGVVNLLIRSVPGRLLAVRDHNNDVTLLWDENGVWVVNHSSILEAAKDGFKTWARANYDIIFSTDLGRGFNAWWRNVNNSIWIQSSLHGAGMVLAEMTLNKDVPNDLTQAGERELDRDMRYLGAPNGVIDLNTGALLTGEAARTKLVTHTIPDPYDSDATHPAVDKLFKHLNPTERDWLLNSLGFALRGNPNRRALLIVGKGGGGKSTLLAALAACLGNDGTGYAGDMSEGALSKSKAVSAGLNPEMAVFQSPHRIVLVGEENTLSNIGRFKRLTGGDNLPVRMPYERQSSTKRVTATMIQAVNEDTLPNLRLENEATFDRLRTLPYPSLPEDKRDTNLSVTLVDDPKARQAMLALMVKRAVYNTRPPVDIPSVAELRREVRRESVGAGFHDWVTTSLVSTQIVSDILLTSDLWDAARTYAGPNGDVDEVAGTVWGMKRQTLVRKIRALLDLPSARLMRRNDASGRGWSGIRLATPAEFDRAQQLEEEQELNGSERSYLNGQASEGYGPDDVRCMVCDIFNPPSMRDDYDQCLDRDECDARAQLALEKRAEIASAGLRLQSVADATQPGLFRRRDPEH